MSKRVFAESMYRSLLWQVVQENLSTGEHSVLQKDLSQEDARKVAEKMQLEIDKGSAQDTCASDALQ